MGGILEREDGRRNEGMEITLTSAPTLITATRLSSCTHVFPFSGYGSQWNWTLGAWEENLALVAAFLKAFLLGTKLHNERAAS